MTPPISTPSSALHESGFNSLPTTALYEEVANLLRQRIFAGDLQPGDWVDEVKLAAQFGISRTPMREAIKLLAGEGLITMRLRRGAYVTQITQEDLAQIYHLLGVLEGDACAQLAKRITPAQLATLTSQHEQLCIDATRDTDAFFATNQAFHLSILEFSNNKRRLQMVLDLRKMMKLHRHNSLLKAGRTEDSLAEHHAILQAIRQSDPAKAQAAMQAHIHQGFLAAI